MFVKDIDGQAWLFIADGAQVLIFEHKWQASNYCLLRFGKLPEFR